MKKGFLLQQKPAARPRRHLRTDSLSQPEIAHMAPTPEPELTTKVVNEVNSPTYFDLLPVNVKQTLMQWIWYTQPKIAWMGDGRDESIRLARMLRLQRIANEILKIDNVNIYGGQNV